MMTFDDIKESFNKLSDTQKYLVSDLVDYDLVNVCNVFNCRHDLAAYIESAQNFIKDGNIDEELCSDNEDAYYTNEDLQAVIQYLTFANTFSFPKVFKKDFDDKNRIIDIDDFDTVSLFDYIDNKSDCDNLKYDFFWFVIDPENNKEPDIFSYNEEYFEHEAEEYVAQHNAKVVQERENTDYYLVDDDRLGTEVLLSTNEDTVKQVLIELGFDAEIKELNGNELRDTFVTEDSYLNFIDNYLR